MDLILSTVSSHELRVSSHWLYTEIKHHKYLMWAELLTQVSSAQPDVWDSLGEAVRLRNLF